MFQVFSRALFVSLALAAYAVALATTAGNFPHSLQTAVGKAARRIPPARSAVKIAAPFLTRETKLTASDTAAGDDFGLDVAVSGDTAVVGSPLHDGVGGNSGSAYVFVRSAGVWSLQQTLTASDAAANEQFGYSVAVNGDTAVVGALDDDGVDTDSGSAYVFVRSAGVWTQQQKLTAGDAAAFAFFGASVAVDGDAAVIGSPYGHQVGSPSGAAYVFTRTSNVWSQQQKLTASDAVSNADFGISVSLSGDTALVGAMADDGAGTQSGSAYVFVRSAGVWSQQQKLTASDAASFDRFGFSVSLSGDTAVVGSALDDDVYVNSGSAHVFVRSGGVWTEQQKLTATDAGFGNGFGLSVAVSGDTVVVGSGFFDDGGSNVGSAYVFARNGSVWSQRQKLMASDGQGGDGFGVSVSLSGDTAVVGSFFNGVGGSAYVYEPGSTALSALSEARVWIGVKNSDDVVLKLDLLAEVLINGTKVGQGQLDNIVGGGAGFNNALLNRIPLALTGGAVDAPPGSQLAIKVSARRSCSGGGHTSGTARLWYNGQLTDTGNDRDAGSRFDATLWGTARTYFLRNSSALNKTAGFFRLSADAFVNSSAPCPLRPFTSFGTWLLILP